MPVGSVRGVSLALAAMAGFVLAGLTRAGDEGHSQKDAAGASTPEAPAKPIQARGVENAFQLSPRLYSGSQPEGDAGFQALRRLGIKTIVTVDGARPDLARAHRFGMRYVHLPIGYDGVPRGQQTRLIKAIEALPGPVFVHCHHGKHRGPAAAATCALATEGWSRAQALAWLEQAGTAPEYPGLFESIKEFAPPSDDALAHVTLAELPEQAEVPGLVELMVEVDKRWDHLKAIEESGFQAPRNQPDLAPAHEARMLVELFREAGRLEGAHARGDRFIGRVQSAEREAASLEKALRAFAAGTTQGAKDDAKTAFEAVGRACASCHTAHRN